MIRAKLTSWKNSLFFKRAMMKLFEVKVLAIEVAVGFRTYGVNLPRNGLRGLENRSGDKVEYIGNSFEDVVRGILALREWRVVNERTIFRFGSDLRRPFVNGIIVCFRTFFVCERTKHVKIPESMNTIPYSNSRSPRAWYCTIRPGLFSPVGDCNTTKSPSEHSPDMRVSRVRFAKKNFR